MSEKNLLDVEHQLPNKRAVTSYSECRRRKQKCNHQKPCNHCLKRRIPERCVYADPLPSGLMETSKNRRPNMPPNPPQQDLGIGTSTETSQTASDLGYSLVSESNNFTRLAHLLHSEDETGQVTGDHNSSHNPLHHPGQKMCALLSKLPKNAIMDELVANFFTNVNWHYDIVEKFYFDDMLCHWRTGEASSMEYLSTKDFNHEIRGGARACQKHSDIGAELVGLLGRYGLALTAVQADLLRASYLKNVGRGTEAWFSAGDAIRQAQQLGLHRQRELRPATGDGVETTLSLVWYDEYTKRLWVNLFIWDSLMAMILGRPRSINVDDCDAQLPIDCNIPKQPSKTVPMTMLADGSAKLPSTVSAKLVRYALAGKVHEMRALKLDRPHPKEPSLIQDFHEQIISILDKAPPILRPKHPDTSWDSQFPYLSQQREELLTLANLFLTTLHRPHIAIREDSRLAATQAALVILKSQRRLFDISSTHLYKLFSLSFYTIDAAILVSVITAMYPPQNLDLTSEVDLILQQAIERLSIMEPFNSMASTGLDIVRRCYQKLKANFNSSNNSSNASAFWHLQKELASGSSQRDSQIYSNSPSGEMDINFSTTDIPRITDGFLRTYWLEQISQFQPSPWIASDSEWVWDPSSFT